MQCNAMLSLPFGVGKNSSWVRVYNMAVEREREKERVSEKRRLCLSRTNLFFPLLPALCLFGRDTHTHTRVSLEGLFFFKRCNFDAIVCFAVSLTWKKKKEDWTAPFYFFFFFFFLVFVFVMKGWREATKSCCSAARTRMVVRNR